MSLQLFCLYTHRYSLALVMTLVLVTATTDDSGPPTNITAVLGRTATFRCHIEKRGNHVTRLYIQKVGHGFDNEIFINGFDESKLLDVPRQYQNRTKVNKQDFSMEITNVSVSDEGLYKCIVFFRTGDKKISQIYLKVTAEYSVPTIERECSEHKQRDGTAGKSCQLICSSVGGYPQDAVRWAGLNRSLMSDVYNVSLEDPLSKTWTINQTMTYNCNHPTNVSCAVGGIVSPTVTICAKKYFPTVVIVAIAVVLVFVLLLLLAFMVMKHCYRRPQNSEDESDPENVDVPLADCHSQLKRV